MSLTTFCTQDWGGWGGGGLGCDVLDMLTQVTCLCALKQSCVQLINVADRYSATTKGALCTL